MMLATEINMPDNMIITSSFLLKKFLIKKLKVVGLIIYILEHLNN